MSDAAPHSQTQSQRRAEITEAALAVLSRDGYAALTARKVAAEADLSLGHITYNFSGMDEVMAEAYRMLSTRLRAASDAGSAIAAPDARLAAFLRVGFAEPFLTQAYIRARIDLWSAAAAHPAVAETELALYTHYRRRLEEILAPLVHPARLIPVTDTIMATLDGLWLDWMRRRNLEAVDNGLRMIGELVAQQPRPDGT